MGEGLPIGMMEVIPQYKLLEYCRPRVAPLKLSEKEIYKVNKHFFVSAVLYGLPVIAQLAMQSVLSVRKMYCI